MPPPTPASNDTPPLTVVWIADAADADPVRDVPTLASLGLQVQVSTVQHSPQVVADVRVLPLRAFDRLERLAVEYPLDPRPTLLLGNSAEDAEALLQIARNSDDVGHAGETPATLARRVQRLAGLADSYRRAGEDRDRDALTGLWNRRRMDEALARFAHAAPAIGMATGLLMLDLDRFKQVNDTFGHAVGDTLLRRAAGALRKVLYAQDVAARLGGEEFVVLLQRGSEAEVLDSAERLRALIGSIDTAGLGVDGRVPELSASAGLAFHTPGLSQEEWLQRTDMALYEAKSKGRDRLVSYESLAAPAEDAANDLQVRHFQNVTQVVTERVASLISLMGQQVVRSIQKDANQDALTGVFNRRYFDKRIAREFALCAADGRPLTLLFIDIDNFGEFNRSHGAPTGDAVLRQFAGLVAQGLRPVDWLARYGGEEFCVVMPAPLAEALAVAERLRTTVAEASLKSYDGLTVQISVSIGVAAHVPAAEQPDDLVQRASKALQQAKRLGRNRVQAADR